MRSGCDTEPCSLHDAGRLLGWGYSGSSACPREPLQAPQEEPTWGALRSSHQTSVPYRTLRLSDRVGGLLGLQGGRGQLAATRVPQAPQGSPWLGRLFSPTVPTVPVSDRSSRLLSVPTREFAPLVSSAARCNGATGALLLGRLFFRRARQSRDQLSRGHD